MLEEEKVPNAGTMYFSENKFILSTVSFKSYGSVTVTSKLFNWGGGEGLKSWIGEEIHLWSV